MGTEHVNCKHEKDWGQTQAALKTLFIQMSELREDVACLEKQNVIIERLSNNFQHLLQEVRDSNTIFQDSLKSIDTRISSVSDRMSAFENSEGDFWRDTARGWFRKMVEFIFIAGLGAIVGQALMGG